MGSSGNSMKVWGRVSWEFILLWGCYLDFIYLFFINRMIFDLEKR